MDLNMRLGGTHLPIEHLSATSLAKAITCPEKWRRRYLQHEKEGFSIDRFIGEVDHTTWESNFKWKLDCGSDMSLDHIISTYNGTFSKVSRDGGLEESEVEPVRSRGELMISAYYETAQEVLPIAVEQRFEERIPGVSIPIIGYPDIETAPEIVERKTSKTKLSKPKTAWGFQARIYQLVYDKRVRWDIVTKQVTPQVVSGKDVAGLNLFQSNKDATVRMIQQTVHQLNDFYERYGADSPWPTNGIFGDWACAYCGFGPNHSNNCVAWGINAL